MWNLWNSTALSLPSCLFFWLEALQPKSVQASGLPPSEAGWLAWPPFLGQLQTQAANPFDLLGPAPLWFGLLLLLNGLLIWALLHYFTAPLKQLTQVAQQLGTGDFTPRVKLLRKDALGLLGQAINLLADKLQAQLTEGQTLLQESQDLHQTEIANRQLLEQTLQSYLDFALLVAQGDLTQQLQTEDEGPLGDLGRGLNSMVDALRSLTHDVQQTSGNIKTTSTEILGTTSTQSASVNRQSAAITETTAAIEQIRQIAAQVNEQAQQAAQKSEVALQVALQGATAVEEATKSMAQIHAQVQTIAQTIQALAEQTKAINTIIAAVSELDDQSNLLALNAAIEAARAGEQGRSFAIVAQNVRELSNRSKLANKQVQEILGEIQRTAQTAVAVSAEGAKCVETGVALTGQVGVLIVDITKHVELNLQTNTEMASAIQQQSTGIEQINQAMESIQGTIQQTALILHQTEQAVQALNNLAETLEEAIDVTFYHYWA